MNKFIIGLDIYLALAILFWFLFIEAKEED